MGQIRLLVVDDSLLMQKVLSDIIQTDPQITIVGTARDGEEAIKKIQLLRPNVVTLDIEMPKMNGLTAVRKIMETNPTPVIMISALTQPEAQLALKALEFGAVDYIAKPSGQISLNMDAVKNEILIKIKMAAHANIALKKPLNQEEQLQEPTRYIDKIISIAASTGGPPAVSKVLQALPVDVPPILVVQHMPKGVTKLFAEGLSERCKFPVKEAEEGDKVEPGRVLVAPGGFHMTVNKDHRIHLTTDPPVNYVRPAADVMMLSLAEIYGAKNIAVVLTGMGSDGAAGIRAIKQKGGITIAHDKETSIVYGMPSVAFQTGCVDTVAPLECIPKEIMKACS